MEKSNSGYSPINQCAVEIFYYLASSTNVRKK